MRFDTDLHSPALTHQLLQNLGNKKNDFNKLKLELERKMEQENRLESGAFVVKEIQVASNVQRQLKACLTSFDLQ